MTTKGHAKATATAKAKYGDPSPFGCAQDQDDAVEGAMHGVEVTRTLFSVDGKGAR
jgi:hypothetical protein